MAKDNIIAYVSSRNNYDMLENEVLKNLPLGEFEFINVDDNSSKEEIEKGKEICDRKNIVFLENKNRGVQWATQTLVDYIIAHRQNCKFIVCFQHDIYPITENFFERLSKLIDSGKLSDFGGIGFNVLDRGKYTTDSYTKFKLGHFSLGMLGLAHLSVLNEKKRWISPHHNQIAIRDYLKWKEPFIIEIPMWAAVGISVDVWRRFVIPTNEYHFHLWFPDIAMQMNLKNFPIVVLPKLCCLNEQDLKEKYGIPSNSAHAAKAGDTYHFGEYGPHLEAFERRWGWNYRDVKPKFEQVKQRYQGTMIYQYYHHDINNGPLANIDLGEY